MIVYVLVGEVQYKGQTKTLLGVYTTRDTAEKAGIRAVENGAHDEYTIQEVALGTHPIRC
jgi:hypothetical protein